MAEGTERPRAAVNGGTARREGTLWGGDLDGEHGCVGLKPESTAAYLAPGVPGSSLVWKRECGGNSSAKPDCLNSVDYGLGR
jgi:hypothetical protein